MRRLPGLLFNAATRASFVLCTVMLAACALSYVVAVGFWYTPLGDRRWVAASSQRGFLLLDVGDYFAVTDPTWDRGRWWHEFLPGPPDTGAGWLGVRIDTEKLPHSPPRRGRVIRMMGWFATKRVVIAYWPLVTLTGALPFVQFLRRKPSVRPGLCPACGYDLRATPDRCPECGTSAPTSA